MDKNLKTPLGPELLNDLHLTEEERVRMTRTQLPGGYVLLDGIGKVPSKLFNKHCLFLYFEYKNVKDMLDKNEYEYPADYGHLVLVHNMSDDEEALGDSESWAIYRFIGPDSHNRNGWQRILRDKNMDRVAEWDQIIGKPEATPWDYDEIVRLAHEHKNKVILDGMREDPDDGKLWWRDKKILDKSELDTMFITKNINEGKNGDVMILIENSRVPEPTEDDQIIDLDEYSDRVFENSIYIVAPFLDATRVVSANSLFAGSLRLVSVPKYDMPSLILANNIFANCQSMEFFNVPRWPKVQKLEAAFANCKRLVQLEGMTISQCESIAYFCQGDSRLKSVGEIQSPNLINASFAFKGCESLEFLPRIWMDNLEVAEEMYSGCTSLDEVAFDAPSVITVSRIFKGCTNLTSITLNIPSAMNIEDPFEDCPNLETVHIPQGGISSSISFANTKLSLDSILEIIENVPTVGGESIAITNTPASQQIPVDEVRKANRKGWTIIR
jgi:hypothetical protein